MSRQSANIELIVPSPDNNWERIWRETHKNIIHHGRPSSPSRPRSSSTERNLHLQCALDGLFGSMESKVRSEVWMIRHSIWTDGLWDFSSVSWKRVVKSVPHWSILSNDSLDFCSSSCRHWNLIPISPSCVLLHSFFRQDPTSQFRLAIGSYVEQYSNAVHIVKKLPQSDDLGSLYKAGKSVGGLFLMLELSVIQSFPLFAAYITTFISPQRRIRSSLPLHKNPVEPRDSELWRQRSTGYHWRLSESLECHWRWEWKRDFIRQKGSVAEQQQNQWILCTPDFLWLEWNRSKYCRNIQHWYDLHDLGCEHSDSTDATDCSWPRGIWFGLCER